MKAWQLLLAVALTVLCALGCDEAPILSTPPVPADCGPNVSPRGCNTPPFLYSICYRLGEKLLTEGDVSDWTYAVDCSTTHDSGEPGDLVYTTICVAVCP